MENLSAANDIQLNQRKVDHWHNIPLDMVSGFMYLCKYMYLCFLHCLIPVILVRKTFGTESSQSMKKKNIS